MTTTKTNPDLLAAQIKFHLAQESTLSRNQHREAYWLFLHLLATIDENLVEELREGNNLRPFTVSNVYFPDMSRSVRSPKLTPDIECGIRITTLNAKLVEAIQLLADLLPRESVLGEAPVIIDKISFEQDANARTGLSSYRAILEECFYQTKAAPTTFPIRFLSPTGFKTERQEFALPLPPLVFGSLLQRWNKFSPGPLAEDSRLFAELSLRAGRFRIESHTVVVDQQVHSGFTGYVDFRATGKDKFYLQTLEALWRYSFYAGIGYQTAAGLGQVLPDFPAANRNSRP